MLEMPAADVPDFGDDDEWLDRVAEFLGEFGLYYVQVPPDDATQPAVAGRGQGNRTGRTHGGTWLCEEAQARP